MAKRDDKVQQGGARAWLRPLALTALWCLPAGYINLAYGLQSGREPALIVLAVASVFFTAICALRLENQGSAGIRFLAATLVFVGIAYNLSNAIGLAAGHRSQARSGALTSQGARQSLGDDAGTIKQQLSSLNAELGTSSLSSMHAEIADLGRNAIFDRAKKCTDATLLESRAHCAAWEKAKAKLTAAERREKLQAELAAMNAKLRAAPIVEAVDPQGEAIAQALAFAGVNASEKSIGYGITMLLATIAELMAAFGGLMCGARLPSYDKPVDSPAPAKVARAAKPKTAAPSAKAVSGEAVKALFVADLVECERATPFKQLFEMYEARCKAAGVEPESPRAIGLALSGKFGKRKGGDAAYYCRPKLAAVAA